MLLVQSIIYPHVAQIPPIRARFPCRHSGGLQILPNLQLPWNRLVIIVFAALVLAALMAALRYTALGLRMRAVTQNRRMAAAMGIRTPWVDALTFGLGSNAKADTVEIDWPSGQRDRMTKFEAALQTD